MAKDVIEIEILAKGLEKAQADINKLNDSLKKTDETAKQAGKSFLTSMAGIVTSVTAVAVAVKKTVDSYMEQVKAEAHLQSAFSKTSARAKELTKDFSAWAGEQQRVTKYGDEIIVQAGAQLQALAKLDKDGLKKAVKTSMDFASAMGVDLVTAANLVGKTIGSSTNALARYGIQLSEGGTATERMTELMQVMSGKFGGFAEEEGKSAAGQMEIFKNNIDDAGEVVGKIIVNAINPLIKLFLRVPDTVKPIIIAIGILIPAFIALQAAMGPIGAGFLLVGAGVALFAANAATAKTDIKNFNDEIERTNESLKALATANKEVDEAINRKGKLEALIKSYRLANEGLSEHIKKLKEYRQTANVSGEIEDTNKLIKSNEEKIKSFEREIILLDKADTRAKERREQEKKEIDALVTKKNAALAATLTATEREIQAINDVMAAKSLLIANHAITQDEILQLTYKRIELENQRENEQLLLRAQNAQNGLATASYYTSGVTSLMDSMFANSIARAEQGSAKEKELKRKQFIASKVAGIAEAGINIALAITRVLGKPFQNIQIALISALGLGQIAAIAATPMPKFAQGGYSRGGLAMVGEQGPEIVQLPDGSKVIPNNNIKNESFDNRNITINVSSPNAIDFVNQLKRTYGLEVFA